MLRNLAGGLLVDIFQSITGKILTRLKCQQSAESHFSAHCEGTALLGGGFALQGVQTLAVGDFTAVVEEALADGAEVAWRKIRDCLQAFLFVIRQRALEQPLEEEPLALFVQEVELQLECELPDILTLNATRFIHG